MTIHVALNHRTSYFFDRPVVVTPHSIRLRPAPHCRTPIRSYSLTIRPDDHYVNWQQDPQSNFVARVNFEKPIRSLEVEVDLIAEMTVINPFDFFLEPEAEEYPFAYAQSLREELKPYLPTPTIGPRLAEYIDTIDRSKRRTVMFLVDLNAKLSRDISYLIRMEPGVQTAEETLTKGSGSCRDSAWLMIQILRHFGIAARFASGYLIQLTADVKSIDGPSGPEVDFTDLHAWCEVFLPGAGWVGLDPTSGLFAGEGHIPLACTPEPSSAAPISGTTEKCEVEFDFSMSVTRVHEDPRVTLPYDDATWNRIVASGHKVDESLNANDVRLTMGGEPTFVSIDDQDGAEWNTEAVGPTKLRYANQLLGKFKDRFGQGGLLHYGLGKWYPGEPLPRWALRCFWRKDGHALWEDPQWLADPSSDLGHTVEDARAFARKLAEKLSVNPTHVTDGFEDILYYMWKERRLPANVDIRDSKLDSEEERTRLSRIFEQGVTSSVGVTLPLRYVWWANKPYWESSPWVVRSDQMFLIPGDSPMGLRLPLAGLMFVEEAKKLADFIEADPMEDRRPLSSRAEIIQQRATAIASADSWNHSTTTASSLAASAAASSLAASAPALAASATALQASATVAGYGGNGGFSPNGSNGAGSASSLANDSADPSSPFANHLYPTDSSFSSSDYFASRPADQPVRTAMCVEPRGGKLHVFLPPIDRIEGFIELIAAIEQTAAELRMPVVVEGYLPPHDPRLQHISVTPDPGVIEVNVHPAESWDELVSITTGVYDDARHCRLGTEKFDQDGTHTGTGGGNHIVMGAATPADSPFLRRPDVLRSLIGYWMNHPSLSYLFSGKFVGPTSQAPRVDEGRRDSAYELQIAFEQIPDSGDVPPWLVDRIFRHLLVDLTGNTHRSEFCIDKLFSPDSSSGRLGLVEFRAFEMPPHERMSLTQQLLLRALVARFWNTPYRDKIHDWDTSIHDRWLLPHFVWEDFGDVIEETAAAGFDLVHSWFRPHFEFRFPSIGSIETRGVEIELREAVEPWYVLGEEASGGGTSRYVDSSVERMQVIVRGMVDDRHKVLVNGRLLPLHPTGTQGEFVCGVRYRAWQPPSCLHPLIPIDAPLVFDVYDQWMKRSLGGARYYVAHPGGLNPPTFPVNANEAESRRIARFTKFGHTPGSIPELPPEEHNPHFPLTLDLRRGRNRS